MIPSTSLVGKNAIVTGASRGIGSQIALELAARGANIAVCFVSEKSLGKVNELLSRLHALGVQATSIQEDLRAKGAGQRIVNKTLAGLSTTEVHIIVNNAALDPPEPIPVHEVSLDLFDQFMQVNAKAPLELVQASLPHLPAQGGRIISISSVLAQRPDVPFAAWAASKVALECLSRFWAMELGVERCITSNVVAIGPTLTDYHANDPPELLEELSLLPSAAKRLAAPDDVAQIVAFLASDASRWINGDIIQGNGGMIYG